MELGKTSITIQANLQKTVSMREMCFFIFQLTWFAHCFEKNTLKLLSQKVIRQNSLKFSQQIGMQFVCSCFVLEIFLF